MLTAHFMQRVSERLGPEVDPDSLARHILYGLDTGDTAFVCRVNRQGLRCFRFKAFDGRTFYVLIDTEEMAIVTILPPGFRIHREGKDPVDLKEIDL